MNPQTEKYKEGKIYRLNGSDGYFYIGSTTYSLNHRRSLHKAAAKQTKHANRAICKHFNQLGWENVTIELLSNYPCDSKKELLRHEDTFIQTHLTNPLCLNRFRAYNPNPVITPEQLAKELEARRKLYNEKPEIREAKKAYYQANKARILERMKEKYHAEKIT